MKIGIPAETHPGERRVAASPAAVERYVKLGFEVVLEDGAGGGASFPNSAYEAAGARIVGGDEAFAADVVLKVRAPRSGEGADEIQRLREGGTLISFVFPAQNEELLGALRERGVTTLAVDMIPRITRAQKMDALSSTANIAGYRAVVEASNEFGSFFTGQFTAAGKVPPAKVLVIGAGVAGLAAIGAARGLGAIVRAFDTRESVRDQIKSLGGEFLTVEIEESGEGGGGYAKTMSKEFIEAEMALFRSQAKDVDIVVSTALIPGKRAPILWTRDMVEAMRPGSVVVDLAAEQGGNCELTVPGERAVSDNGVVVLGYTDLASRMANVASDLYGTNLYHLLDELGGAEGWSVDRDNEVLRSALVTDAGEITWPPPPLPEPSPAPAKPAPAPAAAPAAPAAPAAKPAASAGHGSHSAPVGSGNFSPFSIGLMVVLAVLWVGLRLRGGESGLSETTTEFLQHLTVFVLACFVGWQVIWSVTPALHTPLMSVTNAISGIIVVGGLLLAVQTAGTAATWIGAIAVLFATINIVGGFQVTRRMLRMFRK
ncbi:MAG: Re/Si-specific NAD(P)(+) transhydrogenase subunit alpha [Planctomycetota bacterium]|nr:Re/Si-specific NAD(P)(+) transhydrogenase subunit alpha [Planctomycetota bacterium]